jgi:hypothetical protein
VPKLDAVKPRKVALGKVVDKVKGLLGSPGDVILEVNRTAVDSVKKFAEVSKAAKDEALVLVSRGGSTLYLVVKR